MDQMLEATLSNLQDMVNESAKEKIKRLEKKNFELKKAMRQAKFQLSTIKIVADKALAHLVESGPELDEVVRKIETPNPKPIRETAHAIEK